MSQLEMPLETPDLREDLKVEQQARQALANDVKINAQNIETMNKMLYECQQVVGGIEIDGPKAVNALQDQEERIAKLERVVKATTFVNAETRRLVHFDLQSFHKFVVVIGTIASLSIFAVALKLWH